MICVKAGCLIACWISTIGLTEIMCQSPSQCSLCVISYKASMAKEIEYSYAHCMGNQFYRYVSVKPFSPQESSCYFPIFISFLLHFHIYSLHFRSLSDVASGRNGNKQDWSHVQMEPWNMEGTRCAFDNNGRILALLSSDGRLKLWDCTVGSLKHEYTPPSHLSSSCTCLRWSRSSRTTVSVGCIPTSMLCVFLKRIVEFAKFKGKQMLK